MYKRALSQQMLDDFKNEDGKLHPLLVRVLKDDTLSLEFRGEGFSDTETNVSCKEGANVYYRGGSLFFIEKKVDDYNLHFNINYCKGTGIDLSMNPSLDYAVKNVSLYKEAMDFWFTAHPKYEREFQQIVVRENNGHNKISHATDYYINDVEYCYQDARFDMIAVKWMSKSHERKKMTAPSISIIEMKYGDGALQGSSGIATHLDDFKTFIDSAEFEEFCKDQSNIFWQKCELGLIPDMLKMPHDINIQVAGKEMIFLLANHDPDSTILRKVVNSINPDAYPFTIKFVFASMMGYGLYEDNMMTLDEFKNYLSK